MVLVDSSIWIDYFDGKKSALPLNELIESNNLCINDLILTELIPSIIHKKENKLRTLLYTLTKIPLEINWHTIILMQVLNLKNGINNIGIADLIIAQNAIDNNLELYSVDKHFKLMNGIHGIRLFNQS